MTYTVKNQGLGPANPPNWIWIDFYLSTDAVITTADIPLTQRVVSSLAAGAESTSTGGVLIPTGLAQGMYYLGVLADSYNSVVETDEGNNSLASAGPLQIVHGIDLIITQVSPSVSTIVRGQSFTVTYTVKNQGVLGGSSFTSQGFYLSTDNVVTTADYSIGGNRNWIFTPAPGGEYTATKTVTVPSWWTPGTYYVGVLADISNWVTKTIETNNGLAATQTLGVTAP